MANAYRKETTECAGCGGGGEKYGQPKTKLVALVPTAIINEGKVMGCERRVRTRRDSTRRQGRTQPRTYQATTASLSETDITTTVKFVAR